MFADGNDKISQQNALSQFESFNLEHLTMQICSNIALCRTVINYADKTF